MAEGNTQLEVTELYDHIQDLVEWEVFATYLRKIKQCDIQTIKRNEAGSIDRQKLALCNKWLSVCNDASWGDVSIAIKKTKQSTSAEHANIASGLRNNGPQDGTEEEITIPLPDENAVIDELKLLHTTYTTLFTETCEHIEELIESKQLSLHRLASRLENAFIPFRYVKGLTKCKLISEIFDILREHSNFLDGSVLELVIETAIGKSDLLQKVTAHNKTVRQFKMTQPIKILKDQLKENKIGKNQISITIRLHEPWGDVYISLVKNLVQTLLKLKGDIQWISVDSGSVQIIIAVPIEEEHTIIATCSQKKDFMKQMGIFYLQIGTNTIVDTEENNQYSFESGLLEACAIGTTETVEFLIHYQFIQHIDIDQTNPQEDGKTPLMIASKNGHGNIAKLLLSAKANVNKQDNNGRTAVMIAKTIEIYQTLVQANADTTIVTHKGSTPLYISCIDGNHEVAEYLLFTLKHDITTRPDGFTLLMAASYGGNYRIVQYLLEQEHADPNIQDNDGWTAIYAACLSGHYTVTELLLKHNADPNLPKHGGWTAIYAACLSGHYTVTELLLKNNADPNLSKHDGRTAIYAACLSGHYTVTELLLKHNADPSLPTHDGWTPLMAASEEGHTKIVELLLQQKGVDPNATNAKKGTTALILASQNGHHDTLELLLTKKVDPNVQKNDGGTATCIYQACLNGHYTVIELLLKHNADPNIPTHDGWTPLMAASEEGHTKIVELLLQQNGVDPNTTNTKNGRPALILASKNGHHDTVELLLTRGADPYIQDNDGHTAIDLASTMTISKLGVLAMCVALKDLTRWKEFANHLRNIETYEIDTIERDGPQSVEKQKMALFSKWLQVCPDGSWSDVVTALKKAKENKPAEEIESKYLTKDTLVTTSGIGSIKYAEHTSTPEGDPDAYHSPETETQWDTTAENQRIQRSVLIQEIQLLKDEQQKLQQDMDTLATEKDQQKKIIGNISIENSRLGDTCEIFKTSNNNLQTELNNLKTELDNVKTELDKTNSDTSELKRTKDREINELTAELNERNRELRSEQTKIKNFTWIITFIILLILAPLVIDALYTSYCSITTL